MGLDEAFPEPGIFRLIFAQQKNGVSTLAEQALLGCPGAPAHINQERQTAMFQRLADRLHKGWRPFGQFDAQVAHQIGVALVEPVALAIGTGPQSVMVDATRAQGLRDSIKQN